MHIRVLIIICVVFGFPECLKAAGFQLQERSASGLGRAFSGEAAMADDAAVIASNPAGMMLLEEKWSVALGGSAVFPEVRVSGFYAPPAPAPPGTTVPAPAGNVAGDAYVPYAYLARRISDRLVIGFGSYTTFGLKTNYPTSFSGRAIADLSDQKTFNLNPALAWRFDEHWSLGAGFDALYAKGKLTSTLPSTLPTLDLTGDDWGYGFNAGVLFEPGSDTRIGLHYRSAIELDLNGRAVSVVPPFNGPVSLQVELPDTVEFSVVHDLDDWSVHGDVMWTNWSKFKQLAPRVIGSPVQPPATIEDWDDSWRFAVGATWRGIDSWTLRAGVAYDFTPVPDSNLTLRIPDADRLWLTLGASWELSPCWTLDFGYAHIFADSSMITDGNAATGVFRGKVSGHVDVVSLGISARF